MGKVEGEIQKRIATFIPSAPAQGFLENGPESGAPACILVKTVLKTVLKAVLWLGFGLKTVNTNKKV